MKPAQQQGILLNPGGRVLGSRNAILSGTANRHHVPDFEGCLSLKSVISGSVVWETPGRRYALHENTYLLLNDRQHYTMTIDSTCKATTFCIFFERGFLEDVFRNKTLPTSTLLDEPPTQNHASVDFIERIEPLRPIRRELQRLKNRLAHHALASEESVTDLYRLAESLLTEHKRTRTAASRLPAVRSSTREELFRRVLCGRDFLLSSLADSVPLGDAARAACLSPFHFHRAFQSAFGTTPHRYAVHHRLERARHLLRATNRRITDICFETGFESLGSFSSLFRRTYGVSPRECRATRRSRELSVAPGPQPGRWEPISKIREVQIPLQADNS